MKKYQFHDSDLNPNRKSRDIRFFIGTVIGIAALLGCYVILQTDKITVTQWIFLSAITLALYLWYVLRLAYRTR